MIKKLSKSIREFKTPALLTPLFVIGEVAKEALKKRAKEAEVAADCTAGQ